MHSVGISNSMFEFPIAIISVYENQDPAGRREVVGHAWPAIVLWSRYSAGEYEFYPERVYDW